MDRRAPVRLLFVLGLVIAGSIGPTGIAQAAAPPAPTPCTGTSCRHPALDSRWQYQLQGVAAYASTGGINVNISRVPFTGGRRRQPVGLRLRPLRRPGDLRQQHDAQHGRRQRRPRARRQGDLLRQRGHMGGLARRRRPVPRQRARARRTAGRASAGSTSARPRSCCRSWTRGCEVPPGRVRRRRVGQRGRLLEPHRVPAHGGGPAHLRRVAREPRALATA